MAREIWRPQRYPEINVYKLLLIYSITHSITFLTDGWPIGYDKASEIAHHAMDHDMTLKAAAMALGYVTDA